MSKVIEFSQVHCSYAPARFGRGRRVKRSRTTDDYRRLLCELRQRPSSEREFLRRLLKRAAANGVPIEFPVQTPVVVTS